REQRLAGAGRTDQEDVALRELDLVLGAAHVLEPLVVVVNGDRERPLGDLLADHVLVEARLDLARDRQVRLRRPGVAGLDRDLVPDDVVAQLDALVADEDRRAGDQLLDLVLALAAERAVQNLLARGTFFLGHGRREKAVATGGVRPIIVEKKTPTSRGEKPRSACCCRPTLPARVAGNFSRSATQRGGVGGALRDVSTWSISPYAFDSSGSMKKSRSMSARIFSIGWPVRSA